MSIFTNDIEQLLRQIAIQKALAQAQESEDMERSQRIESNGRDDMSLWHKFMQWPNTFRGKDLKVKKPI